LNEPPSRSFNFTIFQQHVSVIAMGGFLVGVQINGLLIPLPCLRPIFFSEICVADKERRRIVFWIIFKDLGVVLDRFFKITPGKSGFGGAQGLIGGRIFVFHHAVFRHGLKQVLQKRRSVAQLFCFQQYLPRAKAFFSRGILVVQSCSFRYQAHA